MILTLGLALGAWESCYLNYRNTPQRTNVWRLEHHLMLAGKVVLKSLYLTPCGGLQLGSKAVK